MEIRDENSNSFVRLTPWGYQFPARTGEPYDDNWLMIKGRVKTPDQAWTFHEPCLLVEEALSISAWLRIAAEGGAAPDLEMLEPNISLGLAQVSPTAVTVRFHLRLESAPPSESAEPNLEYHLDLVTSPGKLELAAAAWEAELAPFPYRG